MLSFSICSSMVWYFCSIMSPRQLLSVDCRYQGHALSRYA